MSNTTNVVGYYNGNRWPIQIVVSKLNLTLTLEPGKYILDRAGRKINDPYFEGFADRKQLHRELSDNPVPLISIPVVTPNAPQSAQSNPVRAVTEWRRDERGIRQPVLTQPQPQPVQESLPAAVAASTNESVRPMSMEEARRRGLVRKVREVPEDYGVNDTTGLPPGGIPKMRYSIDPGVNKPAPPLPKEMLALPKDDPNRATRAPLVSSLAQGVRVPAPEDASANPFANTAVANGPANSPIMAGTPAPAAQLTESAGQEPEIVDPESAEPEPIEPEAEPLPEPDVDTPPIHAGQPAQAAPPPPLRPITPKNKFLCIVCQQPFQFRSQLVKHAQAKHAAMINAVLANYPETPPEPPPLR